jgi:hypothetical protein
VKEEVNMKHKIYTDKIYKATKQAIVDGGFIYFGRI